MPNQDNYGFSGDTPSGVSIQANVDRVKSYQSTHTPAQTTSWFYDVIRNNSDHHLPHNLSIEAGVTIDQLWFRQVDNDLEVSIIDSNDKTTIKDWYSGSNYRIESFNTSSGSALLENQVDALVSAMAAFAPPAPGQTTLPNNYQDALNTAIAASWQ